jgi:hypothetical protein
MCGTARTERNITDKSKERARGTGQIPVLAMEHVSNQSGLTEFDRCDRHPTRHSRRCSQGGPCRSRSRGRSGGALSGILFLTLASARRQYFAGRVSAGRASISDEPLHFLERLNPGNLLHRSLAAWTADRVLLCGVRHNKPQLSAPTLKLVNARTFPLYTPRLFAAMPIRSYLGGQRFDPATIPRVGDGPSFLRLGVN